MDSLRDYAKVAGVQPSAEPVAPPAVSVFSRRGQVLDRLNRGEAIDPNELQDIDNHAVSTGNAFMSGLRRSMYGMAASGQAFVGQMAEPIAPEFSKQMIEGANFTLRNIPGALRPEYESFDEASKQGGPVGVIRHALGRLGESAPSAAAMALTSGAGAGIGAATKLGARLGSVAGGVAGMTPLEGGETALELHNDKDAMANTTPGERVGLTLGRGVANAALENVVPQALFVPAMLGKAATVGAKQGLKGLAKRAALLGGEGALGEYGTEGAQELTGQLASNIATGKSDYDLAKAHEAGLSGAVAGLVGGAGSAGVQSLIPSASQQERKPHMEGLQATLNDAVKNYVKDPAKREAYADFVANLHTNVGMSADMLRHALDNESAGELGKAAGMAYENAKDIFRGAKSTISDLASGMAKDAEIDPTKKNSYDSINKRKDFRDSIAEHNPQLAEILDTFVSQAGNKKDQNVLWNAIIRASEDPEWSNKTFAPAVSESFTKHTGVDINDVLGSIRSKSKKLNEKQSAGVALTKFMHESKIPLEQRSSLQEIADVGSLGALSPVQQAYLGSLAAKNKTDVPTLYGSLLNVMNKGASSGLTEKDLKSSWSAEDFDNKSDPTKLAEDTSFINDDEGNTMNEERTRSPFNHENISEALADDKYSASTDTHFPVRLSATDADGNPIPPSVLAKAFPQKKGGQLVDRENVDDSQDSLSVNLSPKSLVAMSKSENNRGSFKELTGDYNPDKSVGHNAADAYSGLLGGLESQGIDVDPAVLGMEGDTPIRINVTTDENSLKNDLIVAHGKDKTPFRLGDTSTLQKRAPLTAEDHERRQFMAGGISSYKQLELEVDTASKDASSATKSAKDAANLKDALALDNNGDDVLTADDLQSEMVKTMGRRAARRAIPAVHKARDLNAIKFVVDKIANNEGVSQDEALRLYTERQTEVIRDKRQKNEFSVVGEAVRNGDLSEEDTNALIEYYKDPQNSTDDPVVTRGKEILDELGLTPVTHRAEDHVNELSDMLEQAHQQVRELGKSSDSPDAVAREGISPDEQAQGEFEQFQKSDASKLNAALSRRTGESEAPVYEEKAPLPQPEANAEQVAREQEARQKEQALPPDMKEKFLAAVRKLAGGRIAVVFDRTLSDKAASASFSTRKEALAELQEYRRSLVTAIREGDKSAETKAEYDRVMAEEQKLVQDTAVLGIIYVATGREGMAGLAEHEAFHGAFKFFFEAAERRILTTAFTRSPVLKKLKEYFKDQPEVLRAIDESPEEAAAYGFQVWMYDPSILKPGPAANGLFQKFAGWLRSMFNVFTPAERAEMLLEDFKAGKRAEPNSSPLQIKLDKDKPWEERASDFAKDVGGLLNTAYDKMLGGTYDRLVDTGNVALEKIAKLGYNAVGEAGNMGGFIQNKNHRQRLWLNNFAKALDGLTPEQQAELHKAMILDIQLKDPKLREKQKLLHKLFAKALEYQQTAGVDIGFHSDGGHYYPLIFSPEKVAEKRDEFLAMLNQPKYASQMERLNKTPEEIWQGITSYIDKGTDLVDVMGEDNEPLAESSHKRTLGFLDKEDRLAFMEDQPLPIIAKYVQQMVRQTEFVRAYGVEGQKLRDLRNEAAETYGATPEQLELVDDYIDGLLGNKEIGMSRVLKDIFGTVGVYENFRLLPLSLFSSLVDPLGVAIRSGNITDAWDTFAYSMKNITKGLKDQNYTRDQWEQLAEDWGIITHAGLMENIDNMYDNITLRGTAKKLNDALFKYNLLNGWVRNNTIMAVKAAHMFFYRSTDPNSPHGARHLEELGLDPSDIVFDTKNNKLLVRTRDLVAAGISLEEAKIIEGKLRNATDKFVRQALLSPNAAELPSWASNPYFMPIAHLKNFTFGFNATINRRIMHELENDNFKPALIATAYVPGMIAADFMKDLLSNAGDEPPNKKGWTAIDYIEHGISRSGLTGSGQFFIDAKEDIVRGGTGVESFSGPAVRQFDSGVRALASGSPDKMWNWVVKAGPFSTIYDQSLMTNATGD